MIHKIRMIAMVLAALFFTLDIYGVGVRPKSDSEKLLWKYPRYKLVEQMRFIDIVDETGVKVGYMGIPSYTEQSKTITEWLNEMFSDHTSGTARALIFSRVIVSYSLPSTTEADFDAALAAFASTDPQHKRLGISLINLINHQNDHQDSQSRRDKIHEVGMDLIKLDSPAELAGSLLHVRAAGFSRQIISQTLKDLSDEA